MRFSGKRRLTGLNTALALALAAGLALVLNLMAARHFYRADLGRVRYFSLSEKTLDIVSRLPGDVDVIVFLGSRHDLYRDVRRLLGEYESASSRIRVEYVDPHRDLARSKELVLRYDVTEPDVVVLAGGGRKRTVPVRELAEYDFAPMLTGRPKLMTAFRGEQVFSSAIQGLWQADRPRVYFLSGHGERQPSSYDPVFGYSVVARQLQRENIEVAELNLGATPAIPADCDLLAVAGPARRLSRVEANLIGRYLDNGGRILLLLDSGKDAGLGDLLTAWGLQLADDRVVGLTLTGPELLVTQYGRHPITERLARDKAATVFNAPRSLQPAAPAGAPAADKPRLTVLASCSEEGWAELSPNQNPPRLDAGVDRPGPVAVAVAIEKGLPRGMDVALRPSRLVAIGDSSFVANGALLAGHTADFFMSAVSWLLERTDSLPIPDKIPGRLRILMSRRQFYAVFGILAVGFPAVVAAAGLVAGWRRRR